MSAGDTDMGLKSRTNELPCFVKVSPSIIAAMPEMLMCNHHLLPAGMISRAVSPEAGARLLCTRPVVGKKGKEIALQRAIAQAGKHMWRYKGLGVFGGAPNASIHSH